jgi:hypothetical protein
VRVQSGARGFSSQRIAYGPALAILMAAVSLLTLVVCANLANLAAVNSTSAKDVGHICPSSSFLAECGRECAWTMVTDEARAS